MFYHVKRSQAFFFPPEKREELLTRHTGAKFVREFRYQVVVDPILHGAQDDYWPSVVYCRGERKVQMRRKTRKQLQNCPSRVVLKAKLPNSENCWGHYFIG